MTPYYQDDAVTLYHGDCLELADVWVGADVMVTDPPYGMKWTKNGLYTRSAAAKKAGRVDSHLPTHDGIANDDSTATRDAALAVWAGKPAMCFGSLLIQPPVQTRHIAVYVKPLDTGVLSGFAGLRRNIEAIYFVGSHPEWVRGGKRSSVFETTWRVAGTPAGLAASSGHPHAKPTDVLRELIGLAPGVVADPFMGSGSTLRAAKDVGRRAIGIELDERYCEIAAKRLSQEVLDFGGVA